MFLTERTVRLGLHASLPHGLIHFLFLFLLEAARCIFHNRKVLVTKMIQLLSSTLVALKNVRNSVCNIFRETAWAAGVEVAAPHIPQHAL